MFEGSWKVLGEFQEVARGSARIPESTLTACLEVVAGSWSLFDVGEGGECRGEWLGAPGDLGGAGALFTWGNASWNPHLHGGMSITM